MESQSLYSAPRIVRVKRRKNEESVDILYIEHKSKRKRVDGAVLFRRLHPDSSTDTHSSNKTDDEPLDDSLSTSTSTSVPVPTRGSAPRPDCAGSCFSAVSIPTPGASFVNVFNKNDRFFQPLQNSRVMIAPPPVKTTLPGEENDAPAKETLSSKTTTTENPDSTTEPGQTIVQTIRNKILSRAKGTRHFQLSPATLTGNFPTLGPGPTSRKRKISVSDTAVFIEAHPAQTLRTAVGLAIPERKHARIEIDIAGADEWAEGAMSTILTGTPPSSQKRPKTRAVRPINPHMSKLTSSPLERAADVGDRKVSSKPKAVNPIVQELLDDIEREQRRNKTVTSPFATGSKYQPKVPARRVKDRVDSNLIPSLHDAVLVPAPLPAPGAGFGMPLGFETGAETDDEYVYDTYVRLPSDEVAQAVDNIDTAGMIVIGEEEESTWDRYLQLDGEEGGEEDDFSDDDENAENYYAADYPDDEIDPDDELGCAYQFRANASDEEEYNLDDPDSDFEPGRLTYPRPTSAGADEDYVHDFDDVAADSGAWNRPGNGSLAHWLNMKTQRAALAVGQSIDQAGDDDDGEEDRVPEDVVASSHLSGLSVSGGVFGRNGQLNQFSPELRMHDWRGLDRCA